MNSTPGLLADVVAASCVDGPGNRFVVFTQGCTFNCLACHNPHTIPRRETGTSSWVEVPALVSQIREAAPFISGVTVSGGEATCQWEFVADLFRTLRADPELGDLSLLVDTNGDAEAEVWEALAPLMDGAMVDLKALDDDLHETLTGRSNARVLTSIEHLHRLGRLAEVRLLIIPDVNDGADLLQRTGTWLAARLRTGSPVRVRLNGFRRLGTRPVAQGWRDATDSDLERAVRALADGGLAASRIDVAGRDPWVTTQRLLPPRPARHP